MEGGCANKGKPGNGVERIKSEAITGGEIARASPQNVAHCVQCPDLQTEKGKLWFKRFTGKALFGLLA